MLQLPTPAHARVLTYATIWDEALTGLVGSFYSVPECAAGFSEALEIGAMETVIQSLLAIGASMALSGCLVNTPPGVPGTVDTETGAETESTKLVSPELTFSDEAPLVFDFVDWAAAERMRGTDVC